MNDATPVLNQQRDLFTFRDFLQTDI
ncbi:hypothetical protein PM8797T_08344 [Gimesia maris DSM 8797]|nr:hypothetical protein PM8797T_08344 [Gimesia maris DSM 8797]